MSAPVFYRLNLGSLTPDLYNAYLDGEYNCAYGDYSIGSVINDNDSFVFTTGLPHETGLCELINNITSKEQFEAIIEGNDNHTAFDYVEIDKFYDFATLSQEAYIVAVTEHGNIIGIGQFASKLYYNPNNAPYNETEIVVDKEASQPIDTPVKKGRRNKSTPVPKYKEVRCVYPYCRKFKWLKTFDDNRFVLKNTKYPNFSRITDLEMIEMLQKLLVTTDNESTVVRNDIDNDNSPAIQAQTTKVSTPVIPCPFAHNRIFFGAPGTGKSYLLEEQRKEYFTNPECYERVTFHPDYSYANFVGTYKPVMIEHKGFEYKDEKQKKIISILTDKTKTAQEKYDLLYKDFQESSLTRLPILVGIYSDGPFKTKKVDETFTNNNNDVERNHGRAIRPYLNLNFDDEIRSEISYEYVPGPFMRIYVEALKNPDKLYLLAIEEINRANVAAVFGDVFQLLDRDDDGNSMYPIHASEDMRRYLAKELGGDPKQYSSIRIPSNMYIWATMNSADQGVFPMDTAFKRRWEFEYIGINTSEQQMSHYNVQLGKGENAKIINWNELRKAINEELVSMNINEDKLMGPFFLSDKIMRTLAAGPDNNYTFIQAFKNKVLMYLFDDAAKQKRSALFNKVERAKLTYSSICEEFDQKGVAIFCDDISNRFIQHDDNEQ